MQDGNYPQRGDVGGAGEEGEEKSPHPVRVVTRYQLSAEAPYQLAAQSPQVREKKLSSGQKARPQAVPNRIRSPVAELERDLT